MGEASPCSGHKADRLVSAFTSFYRLWACRRGAGMTCMLCPPPRLLSTSKWKEGAASLAVRGFRTYLALALAHASRRAGDWRSSSTQTTSCGFSTTRAGAITFLLPCSTTAASRFCPSGSTTTTSATSSATVMDARRRFLLPSGASAITSAPPAYRFRQSVAVVHQPARQSLPDALSRRQPAAAQRQRFHRPYLDACGSSATVAAISRCPQVSPAQRQPSVSRCSSSSPTLRFPRTRQSGSGSRL